MTIEEIRIRQEIRQMLNEAGFNRETIKQMVKDEIKNIVQKQVQQAIKETSPSTVVRIMEHKVDNALRTEIKGYIQQMLFDKKINVEIK